MVRHKASAFLLCATSCLLLFPASVLADDFAPPPWDRSHPRAITAEWEFLTPDNPLGPDGPLTNVTTKGSGSVPSLASIVGSPAGFGWVVGDGDGGWYFTDGGSIHFTLDNILDHEPIKHIWLQVTHTPGLGLGLDPLAPINLGATGAFPGPVSMLPHGPGSTIFYWDMFPNPPWEEFRLVAIGNGVIDQVLIDTISIPEPSSFVLCGIGLVSLALILRRRRHN
jgi:hypothetical protein